MNHQLVQLYHLTNITAHPFENPHVKKLINEIIRQIKEKFWHEGITRPIDICDPFSNNKTQRLQGTRLITNDLNPEFDSTYNLEFNDFGELMQKQKRKFDLILFDPPYSLRQLKEQYDGIGKDLELWQTHNMWDRGKKALAKCVRTGGYVISFGWHTHGFAKRLGFEKVVIMNLEQAGGRDRYNLLVTVEKKVQYNLIEFEEE